MLVDSEKIKIFSQNKNHLKFLVAFGCCYHKMELKNSQNTDEENMKFNNFPISESLKKLFEQKFSDFKLSI